MPNIGDAFTTAIPAVGASGPGYATDINSILSDVMSRLSTKVPLSSISFSGDLNMAGSNILNTGYQTFQNAGVTPGPSPVNRLVTFNGDLWYVSPSGAIQMTTGAALNSAAIGGITGDYGGANPAQFRYVASDVRYNAYANFGTNTLSDVRALGIQVAAGATSSVFARILFSGGSNKTFTLPPVAATSAVRPVYIDSSGNLTAGFSSSVEYPLSAFGGTASSTNVTSDFINGSRSLTAASTTDRVAVGLGNFPVGFVMDSVVFRIIKVGTTNTGLSVIKTGISGTGTTLASTNTTTNGTSTITVNLAPETVATNCSYYALWQPSGGSNAGETFFGVSVLGHFPA